MEKVDVSFLIGRFESEAYELAQEHGFIVFVIRRDGVSIPQRGALLPPRTDRVRMVVENNRVIRATVF